MIINLSQVVSSLKDLLLFKYIFARLKDNEWLVTDGKSVKFDKVFFKKSLINSIPEIKINKDTDEIIKDDMRSNMAAKDMNRWKRYILIIQFC